MHYFWSISLLLLSMFNLSAQRCTHQHSDDIINAFNKHDLANGPIESRTDPIYFIPIVFHVLYSDSSENIPESLLLEQVNILNEDYNGLTGGGNQHRAIFDDVKGNGGIEFYIEKIIRKKIDAQVPSPIFSTNEIDKYKFSPLGSSAIDPERNLNVWVCQFAPAVGSLGVVGGHAYSPILDKIERLEKIDLDGVFIDHRTLGRANNIIIPTDFVNFRIEFRGHTLSHEIGHYLGLSHVFGDKKETCGDDGLADTPKASFYTECGENTISCDGEAFPPMYENFMMSAPEPCQSIFTKDQVDLMHYILKTVRCELIRDCSFQETIEPSLKIGPNPTNGTVTFKIEGDLKVEKIELYDFDGRLIKRSIGHETSISLEHNKPGMYLIYLNTSKGLIKRTILKL